jgi:hypothetical protein
MRLLLAFLLGTGVTLAQLDGVIDIHAHVDPETIPRSVDALDLARLARTEGMRAVVFKNHFFSTAPIAFLVARQIQGVQVFGGIALNSEVGGINPAAVDQMVQLPGRFGRIVWMPTQDAVSGASQAGPPAKTSPVAKKSSAGSGRMGGPRPFRRPAPLVRDGQLLPEVREVLGLIAKHDLALATGHHDPETTLLLIREARKAGIGANRIVVTHPRWAIAQQQEAAKLGAYLEYCFVGTLEFAGANRRTMDDYAKSMKALGPEHCILSTDLGNALNPVHTAGWKTYIEGLLAAGITQQEIDLMAKRNPARLLGLE